jgi:hypothetical protein
MSQMNLSVQAYHRVTKLTRASASQVRNVISLFPMAFASDDESVPVTIRFTITATTEDTV